MADTVEGDVFENVNMKELSLDQIDTNNLVSNTHLKNENGQFELHPGDKVPKSIIKQILDDVHLGEETLVELVRTKAFVHKDEYVPDPETNKGSVESYNQPIYRNQGSSEGEPSPDIGKAKTPAKPAEDKSSVPDPVAEEDVAAKAAHDAEGSGKDTPASKK